MPTDVTLVVAHLQFAPRHVQVADGVGPVKNMTGQGRTEQERGEQERSERDRSQTAEENKTETVGDSLT